MLVSPPSTTPTDQPPVTVREKLAYGAGGVSGALPNLGPVYLFDAVFVVLLGLSPALVSACALIYRLWDGLTDAAMGWISDNTRTRWGRRRPYIFLGAILTAFAMPLAWLVNPSWPTEGVIVWMIVAQLLLLLFSTIWNIPYQCLLMEVTTDSDARTRVAAYRQYFGTFTWVLMGWVWLAAQHPVFGQNGEPDLLRGAFYLSALAGLLLAGFGVLPALFCRERLYHTVAKKERTHFWHDMKLTLLSKSFVALVLCTLLFWIGTQAKGGLAFYARLYYVCAGDTNLAARLQGIEGTAVLIISILFIPVFERIAREKGKRDALTLVLIITLTGSLSTFFFYNPAFPYLSIASGLLMAPAGAAVWVLLPSLLSDVIDEDELRTNERRDGSFSSVFSWIFKVGQSIAAGLSGFLVVASGFEISRQADQTPEAIWGLRMMLIFVPLVCLVAAILILLRFPLTKARIAENQLSLRELRQRRIE